MADVLAWVYNSRTGTVVQTLKVAASGMVKTGLGWHGTWDTKEEAIKFYNDGKAANPGWVAPTGFFASAGNLPNIVTGSAEGVGNAVESKVGFLTDDNIRSWLIRIGEILLGIVLVGVGVAKLTGTGNFVSGLVKAKV